MTRRINEIIADLEQPWPDYEKTKSKGGQAIKFIPWTGVCKILDRCAPGWSSEVVSITEVAGRIVATVALHIDAEEGIIRRVGAAQKLIPKDEATVNQYGDPVKNTTSDAFRRAAALFGVGGYLRGANQTFNKPPHGTTTRQPQDATRSNAVANAKATESKPAPAANSAATNLKLAPQAPADNTKAMVFAEGMAVQIRQHYALLGWCGPNRDDYSTKPIRAFENEFVSLTEWYKDALLGFPLADLQAMLAKLKTMVPGKPEAARTWNSSTFWMAARDLKTTEGFPLVDDETIRVVLRKYPDGKSYVWAAAWVELEDIQREDATRARRVA